MASRRGATWPIWLLIFFVCIECLAQQTSGQFFTKSSKSIPRMGRRSQIPMSAANQAIGKTILYRLLDIYGPDYLETLQVRTGDQSSPGEVAYLNEQPFDSNDETSDSIGDAGYYAGQFGRDERSSKSKPMGPDGTEKSLALRALNVDRYIKHLSSGQPLMPLERNLADHGGKQQNGFYGSSN